MTSITSRMDVTVRNVDEDAYRRLKARAALEDRTVGEVLSEAIRSYVRGDLAPFEKTGSLLDIEPVDFGPGTEQLSERIDEILYGI